MLVLDLIDSYLQTERAKGMKAATFVIYHSLDPEAGHWSPVLPNDVPEWLKDPKTMGRMANGDMAQSVNGGGWYRVEKVEDAVIEPESRA